MDVAETCFINQSSASPKLKPSKDDPDKVAVKPSSESVRHDTFGLTPTIAVLPPSPRHAVSPIESCEISAKASTHESIDSSSVIEGQRLSRPRHLSWSTDVADSCESTLSEMSSVTPTESSYEKLTFTSSAPVSEDRIDKRTLTLPLPRIKRSLSPDLDSRTNRSASTSPTDFSSGAGVETNLWKRQTRRRSQTGPPLFASLHSQLGKMGVRPVTLASEEPAVIVSVEQRHHSAQSGSSSSVPKLRQKWVSVLKEMFKELAEQSDNKGRTLDKETFLKYFPLPGVLGERLFDLFDADGSQTIDFQEFFMGLALIYNGTAEERKRFLFNMYDLDGNGHISREELSALLTHIPAAFEVLNHLAEKRMIETSSPNNGRKGSHFRRRSGSDIKAIEERVASLVHTIFSDRQQPSKTIRTPLRLPSRCASRSSDDGLTYEEFCEALAKNTEISDLLNLFYDLGMPDLPVPHDTLTPNMLHERPPGFFCRRSDSGERHRFRLGLRLPTFSGLSVSSSSSSRAALSTARESPSNADSFVPGPSGSSLPVTPRSFTDEASIYPSPLSFSRSAPAPEINQSDSWKNSFQYQTTSNRTSQSGSDGAIEARTSKGSSHDLLSDQGNSAEKVPIVSGWLYKVGRTFGMKHYRFFVLRDRFLYYYSRVKDQAPKKALFMQDAQIASVCHTEGKSVYPFDICLPSGRTHRLFASNRRDRDVWVHALTKSARTSVFHDYYQLQSPRARGKFAVVHRGMDKMTRQPVAVKILVKEDVGKGDRQFLRTEVAVMRLIHHANVVQFIDVYDSSQYLYVVMEWVSKGDIGQLSDHLKEHSDHLCCCHSWSLYKNFLSENRNLAESSFDDGVLVTRALISERLSLIVARGVLLGLVYLHNHNIIHRDIKPENILMVGRSSTTPASPAVSVESDEAFPSETEIDLIQPLEYPLNESPPPSRDLDDKSSSCASAASSWERLANECVPTESEGSSLDNEWKLREPDVDTEIRVNCPCQRCSLCQAIYNLSDVKITDFGLSKILSPSGRAFEQLGTLSYAAPEVILGKPYDHAVDVWSLGVVMYRLLSGNFPFGGTDDQLIAESVIDGTYTFQPDDVWRDIPEIAQDFIKELLQLDPLKRPTAAQCLDHPWLKTRFHAVAGR